MYAGGFGRANAVLGVRAGKPLLTATDIVDKLSYGSLFRYVAAPEVIADGLNGGHILVFVVTIVVSLAVALPIFMRRDLKTR